MIEQLQRETLSTVINQTQLNTAVTLLIKPRSSRQRQRFTDIYPFVPFAYDSYARVCTIPQKKPYNYTV